MRISLYLLIGIIVLLLPSVIGQGLTVNSPGENERYDSTFVLFNLTAANKSFFYYSNLDNSGNWIKICPKKDNDCVKKKRVYEGWNNLSFKAVDNEGNSDTKDIWFFVDSRKPKINKIEPRINKITNGSFFSVTYSEENPVNVIFYYGDKQESKDTCEAGTNKQCDFENLNFSEYNGKYIYYWFNVSDGLNDDLSKRVRVKVDTDAPEITSFTKDIDGRKVRFILDIKEDNFDKIIYEDESDCGPIYNSAKRLCSNLRNGRCVVTRSFCVGEHGLNITVSDEAGNSAVQETSFTIED